MITATHNKANLGAATYAIALVEGVIVHTSLPDDDGLYDLLVRVEVETDWRDYINAYQQYMGKENYGKRIVPDALQRRFAWRKRSG